MTKPMRLADFQRLPPVVRAHVAEGLTPAIDAVAARGPASHAFLRYGWFAAALAAYGGAARTLLIEEDEQPVLALPFTDVGPAWAKLAAVPGSYWPFRSFAVAEDAGAASFDVALATLAQTVNGVRIGPVYDGDPAATPLIEAARARGWAVLDRFRRGQLAARYGGGAGAGRVATWIDAEEEPVSRKTSRQPRRARLAVPERRGLARGVRCAGKRRGGELDRVANRRIGCEIHQHRTWRILGARRRPMRCWRGCFVQAC